MSELTPEAQATREAVADALIQELDDHGLTISLSVEAIKEAHLADRLTKWGIHPDYRTRLAAAELALGLRGHVRTSKVQLTGAEGEPIVFKVIYTNKRNGDG